MQVTLNGDYALEVNGLPPVPKAGPTIRGFTSNGDWSHSVCALHRWRDRAVAHADAVAPQSPSRRSQCHGVAENPETDVRGKEYFCAGVRPQYNSEGAIFVPSTIVRYRHWHWRLSVVKRHCTVSAGSGFPSSPVPEFLRF